MFGAGHSEAADGEATTAGGGSSWALQILADVAQEDNQQHKDPAGHRGKRLCIMMVVLAVMLPGFPVCLQLNHSALVANGTTQVLLTGVKLLSQS